MESSRLVLSIAAATLALACFVLALAFPAVGTCYNGSDGTLPNWFDNSNILLFGWLAAIVGQFGWFANIPFAFNIYALCRGRPPRWLIIVPEAILLLVALVSLQPSFGSRLPHNEGYDEAVCYLGPGFWLWVAAHLVGLAMAVVLRLSTRRPGGDGS